MIPHIPLVALSALAALGVSLDTGDGVDASVDVAGIQADASLDEELHAQVDAAGVSVGTEELALPTALPAPGDGAGTDQGDPAPASDDASHGSMVGRAIASPEAEEVARSAPLAVLGALLVMAAQRTVFWTRAGLHLLRFAVVAIPVTWLFSRIDEGDLVKNKVRAAILEQVRADPGATIKEVQDTQAIAWGTAVYHLQRLERGGYLVSEKVGRLHRYWERNTVAARDRQATSLLMDDTPRGLAEAVQARPGIRQKGLCAALGISGPVASKYLSRLEKEALVVVRPAGNAKEYYPGPGLRGLHHAPATTQAMGAPGGMATGA